MKKSALQEFIKGEILNEMAIEEMAKINSDKVLKTAIEDVINDKENKKLDILSLKKTIKADPRVQDALGDQTLNDTQLNGFISKTRGERKVGKRGRKPDPNAAYKQKKTGGTRGRPKVDRPKDSVARTSKLGGRKYYTKKTGDNTDGPTDAELRKLASSGGNVGKSKDAQLKQQQKRKLVKAFLQDMKDQGIVDSSNKVIDKEKYDAARAVEMPKIQTQVNQMNESFPENPDERVLVDRYVGMLDDLKQDFPSDGKIQAKASALIGDLLDYINM